MKKIILYLANLLRFYWHQPRILKSLIKLNIKSAFDVGSHEGETLDYFLKIKKLNKIHSFEPQSLIFKKLVKKFKTNKKIILNNVALSNKTQKKKMFINLLTATSSFTKVNSNSDWLKIKNKIINQKNSRKKTIILKTSSIDTYVKKRNINKIDLLKIDTEGHELQVLQGAINSIKKKKIKYVLIELHFSNMYKHYSRFNIEKYLKDNNFYLIKSFKFPLHPYVDNLYKLKI